MDILKKDVDIFIHIHIFFNISTSLKWVLRSLSRLKIVIKISISGPGLLIAGGQTSDYTNSIELFNLRTNTSCPVNVTLDISRGEHTADGDLVCGGYNMDVENVNIGTCYNVLTGNKTNLVDKRWGHISWSTDAGVYLIGGTGLKDKNVEYTTEFILDCPSEHTKVSIGFELKYPTKYVSINICHQITYV